MIEDSCVEHGRMRYEKTQDLQKMNCDSINGYCKQKADQGNVVISVMKWYNIVTVEVKPVSTSQVSRIQGVHLCSAARCGKNGKCVAHYLGGDVPVTPNACICNDGWSGKLCQFNPCFGKSCSGHGKCTATSDQDAKCLCNDGFSWESCQNSCDGIYQGSFPYGSAPQVAGAVKLGCTKDGHCNCPGFCTYRGAVTQSDWLCGSKNDCKVAVSCISNGSCSAPQYLPDATPCNSVPFGTCRSGICVDPSPVRAVLLPSQFYR